MPMPMPGRRLRGWRSAGTAAGTLALLAGCSLGGASHEADTPTPVAASAPPPVGSVAHPRPVWCVEGTTLAQRPSASASPKSGAPSGSASGTPGTPRAAKGDVTVGPLTWRGLGALADGDQSAHGVHNADGWHYRLASEIKGAASVTVTIGPEQRARAALQYGIGSGMSPAPAVTFHSCPGGPTVFIGALFVAGDGRACVPLDIRVDDAPPQRVTISFFQGSCPA
jgi:hypothetical protein